MKLKNANNGDLIDRDLAENAGLVFCSYGSGIECEREYIGTIEQWNEYNRLEKEEAMEENNKLDLMESQLADCEDLE